MKLPAISCVECGEKFIPLRRNVIRCSRWCREVYKDRTDIERNKRSKAAREKLRKAKPCRYCGLMFKPVSPRRVFCTAACRDNYRSQTVPKPKPLPKLWFAVQRQILKSDLETDISGELKRYQQRGGTITVLPAETVPAIPSVGIQARGGYTGSEWSTSALAGMGEYEDIWRDEDL
jgi:hypothetical protein